MFYMYRSLLMFQDNCFVSNVGDWKNPKPELPNH